MTLHDDALRVAQEGPAPYRGVVRELARAYDALAQAAFEARERGLPRAGTLRTMSNMLRAELRERVREADEGGV